MDAFVAAVFGIIALSHSLFVIAGLEGGWLEGVMTSAAVTVYVMFAKNSLTAWFRSS